MLLKHYPGGQVSFQQIQVGVTEMLGSAGVAEGGVGGDVDGLIKRKSIWSVPSANVGDHSEKLVGHFFFSLLPCFLYPSLHPPEQGLNSVNDVSQIKGQRHAGVIHTPKGTVHWGLLRGQCLGQT